MPRWCFSEDGSSTDCMLFMSVELLAERVGVCGEDSCEALLPDLEEVFDAVLADSDEACSSIEKMKAKLAE